MTKKDLITIIIPTYNEEKFIQKCLQSVQSFLLPKDIKIEIIVIDGGSKDNTTEIVLNMIEQDKRIVLLDNPKKIQAVALNIGISKSNGEWILRLDAHAMYPSDYLKLCFETAIRTNADNVGGLIITQPGGTGYQASLVQALTTHIFGVGNSGFRTGISEGEVDTVPFGFFNRDVFEKIGYFDERLIRAQDYEFNKRIKNNGGKIWLNPGIVAQYYNQKSILKFLEKQILKEAPYNAYMWYLVPYTFAYRHAITGVFATGVLGGLALSLVSPVIKFLFLSVMALYFIVAFVSAVQQAKRFKKPLHILTLPISFFLYHIIHGIGVLTGFFRLATGTSPIQKIKEPWEGYGSYRIKLNKSLKK